jgi:parallel beta-helix repeat protein
VIFKEEGRVKREIVIGIMLFLIVANVFVSINIPTVNAEPTTWIVDDDGPADFSSIQDATNLAKPRDTIIVKAGIYTETVIVNQDNLTIESESGSALTTVQAPNSSTCVFEVNSNFATIKGFTIRNGDNALSLFSANNCTIQDNNFLENWNSIYLKKSSQNEFSGNVITTRIYEGVGTTEIIIVGTEKEHYNNFFETSNTVNERPIYYYYNRQDELVEGLRTSFLMFAYCSGMEVKNCVVSNGSGIRLESSTANYIHDNTCEANYAGVLCTRNSNGNNIHNNVFSSNLYGTALTASGTNILINNFIAQNYWAGISVFSSNGNVFYLNKIIYNEVNVELQDTTNVWNSLMPITYIFNDKAHTGYVGNYWSNYSGVDANDDAIGDTPHIIDSNNADNYPLMASIVPQLPVHNLNNGIAYSTIQEAIDATTTLSGHTIFVEEGIYYENVTLNKSITLVGESRETTIIDGNQTAYTIVGIREDDTAVINFTIRNSHHCGITVAENVDNVSIENNSILNCFGRPSYQGVGIMFSGNNVSLTGNLVEDSYVGIGPVNCAKCLLRNNTMRGNLVNFGLEMVAITSDYYNYDIDSSNLVDGRPIYLWVNESNKQVPTDAGFFAAIDCYNITLKGIYLANNAENPLFIRTNSSTIEDCVFKNSVYGAMLGWSNNNTISRTEISVEDQNAYVNLLLFESNNNKISDCSFNCYHGFGVSNAHIKIVNSSYNTIIGNTIENGSSGLALVTSQYNFVTENEIIHNLYAGATIQESNNNTFYHNSFIDNGLHYLGEIVTYRQVELRNDSQDNIWDNDFPSGGNYWSDYNGTDVNGDGIGDIPYSIDADNQDNYPLMTPWLPTPPADSISPTIQNVRHEPLYPIFGEEILVYADVTDNVAVSTVWVNYTLNGGATWLLKQMTLTTGNTYSASLGDYSQFQIIGFTVIAYDTSGNKAVGSEDSPPTGPPVVAPIVVSDEPAQPLPNGEDIRYNMTETGTEVIANVSELGIYGAGAVYSISYSLDGGITWIKAGMTQVSAYVWSYVIPDITNILFKVEGDNGESTQVYWIIVGPWEYPIYLYFSTAEEYYPVKGLDFDGDSDITNNWASYESTRDNWINDLVANDIDGDGTAEVWSYAYMNPKTIDDGCLVIEYWIYYAFNDYAIDRHEHDFESVFLWVDIATGNIKKIACTQHKWVNHYVFDVNNPPVAINLAVENGGHGMALLTDQNNDGLPDINILGSYIIQPGVNQLGVIDVPMFFKDSGTINPNSFVAQLYPWTIYDPRIPSSELHLFDDPSILTNGLSLDAISPFLPNVVSEIPQYYGFLTNLLTVNCVLKTSFGAPLLGDSKLVFSVIAPLYRQEFQEPWRMWNKVSFGWWLGKMGVKAVVDKVVGGALNNYFKVAGLQHLLTGAAGDLTSKLTDKIINVFVDPAECYVFDSSGGMLSYGDEPGNLVGGAVFTDRNMTNNLYDLYLIMTNSTNDYVYEVRGTEAAQNYTLVISLLYSNGTEVNFNATEIPIHVGVTHKFWINWTALEEGESAVQVQVDWNGDGTPDDVFWSDGELTSTEFIEAIGDSVPPVTADDYDGFWHTSDFTVNLVATDSSGISEIYYRINGGSIQSVSIDDQPRITVESGINTLEYWSIDGVGNEELPHKMLTQIKLDKTAPTGSVVINNGASSTTSTSVTLTLTTADTTSGVYQVRFSNDGIWDTEQWETPSASKTWTLTSGNGEKTVYYQIIDNAGLTSSTYSDTITLTSPPSDSGDSGTSSGSSSSLDTTPSPTPSPSPSPTPAPTPTPSPSPQPTSSPTSPPEERPLFLYVIIVAVAFALIGGVAFMLKKRRSSQRLEA